MSLLEKWAKAIELRDEDTMNECLHDDYKFTLHSAGKILSKSEVIAWGMSGDINRKNVSGNLGLTCIQNDFWGKRFLIGTNVSEKGEKMFSSISVE